MPITEQGHGVTEGLTHDFIKAHMAAEVAGSVQINNTMGWYSAGFTLDYTFSGKRIPFG